MRKLLGTAFVGLCTASLPVIAHASIILTLNGSGPVAVSGGFDYTYQAYLSQDEQLDPTVQPVFFTLYDFGNATLKGTTGALGSNWAFVLNVNQTTPAEGTAPSNNASADVRATYTGPDITGPSLGTSIGNLGTFTLFTTNTGPFAIFTNSQDAQLEKFAPGTPTDDTKTSNLAAVAVPTNGRSVPEPASLTLLGAALAGIGIIRRRA